MGARQKMRAQRRLLQRNFEFQNPICAWVRIEVQPFPRTVFFALNKPGL